MSPYFTIVVPNFNYGRYISDCLSSIQCQTFEDFEVLICDAGSTDISLDIIKAYLSDERFKLFSTSDNGQVSALNNAFSASISEIHMYLNSDDSFAINTALAAIHSASIRYVRCEIFSFGGYYTSASGKRLSKIDYSYNGWFDINNMAKRVALLQPASAWRSTVRKSRNPYFREDLATNFDTVFFWELYNSGSEFYFSNIPISNYRIHDQNISFKDYHLRLTNNIKFASIRGDRFSQAYLTYILLIYNVLAKALTSRCRNFSFILLCNINNALSIFTRNLIPRY